MARERPLYPRKRTLGYRASPKGSNVERTLPILVSQHLTKSIGKADSILLQLTLSWARNLNQAVKKELGCPKRRLALLLSAQVRTALQQAAAVSGGQNALNAPSIPASAPPAVSPPPPARSASTRPALRGHLSPASDRPAWQPLSQRPRRARGLSKE